MMFNETSYNLGDLSGPSRMQYASTVSKVGSAIPGPVGSIVSGIGKILGAIFAGHAAKVVAEDQATGDWAASGPQSIDSVMAAWRSGQMSSSDALASLQSVMDQYKANMASVSKYNGQFGVFPNPDSPRPANNCNAACGIFWDTMQQVKGYQAEIGGGGGGLNLSSMLSGGGVAGIPLPILVIGGLILFKVIKI